MPRQARIDISGLLYHVMIRGIERREIFPNRIDKEDFIERLGKSLTESGAKCFSWVLMPNHAHLLIRVGEKKLSRIMRGLLSGYATKYNIRHKRSGHLFQNRYKAIICEEERYLLELIRYIHLNPIRANIVKDMRELDKYEWSGHSIVMGNGKRQWQEIADVLKMFGSVVSTAREKYREYIEEGIKLGKHGVVEQQKTLINRKTGIEEQADERVLGSGEFVESIIKGLEEKDKIKNKMKKGLDIEKLTLKVSKYYGLKITQIKGESRMREVSKARAVMVNIGIDYLGLSGRSLEKELDISSSGISKLYRRGEKLIRDNEEVMQEIIS